MLMQEKLKYQRFIKEKDFIQLMIIFERTNSFTTRHHQRPTVELGHEVKKGDLLADTSSSDQWSNCTW
jgi:hypothetical protein